MEACIRFNRRASNLSDFLPLDESNVPDIDLDDDDVADLGHHELGNLFHRQLAILCNFHGWRDMPELETYATRKSTPPRIDWPVKTISSDTWCGAIFCTVEPPYDLSHYLKRGVHVRRWRKGAVNLVGVLVKRVELPPHSYIGTLIALMETNRSLTLTLMMLLQTSSDRLHGPETPGPWHSMDAHRTLTAVIPERREAWAGRLSSDVWDRLVAGAGKTVTGKLDDWTYLPTYNIYVPTPLVVEYRHYMVRVGTLRRAMRRFVDLHSDDLDRLLWAPHTGLMPLRACRKFGFFP